MITSRRWQTHSAAHKAAHKLFLKFSRIDWISLGKPTCQNRTKQMYKQAVGEMAYRYENCCSSLNYTATSCSHHDYELSHLRSRIHFIVPPFEAQVETTRHRCEYTLTSCKSTKLLACLQHESPSFHTFQTILSFFCLMSKIRRHL